MGVTSINKNRWARLDADHPLESDHGLLHTDDGAYVAIANVETYRGRILTAVETEAFALSLLRLAQQARESNG